MPLDVRLDNRLAFSQLRHLAPDAWLRRLLGLFLYISCFPGMLLALDPQKQIGQYGHDSWTSERGLPGEAVYQILQSLDGYLWMRTSAGLVRFDGVRFVTMDAIIGNEPVAAICLDRDGELLVRTTTRTVLYKGGVFSDVLPAAPLPDGGIRVLFESQAGQVLVGADDFIYLTGTTGTRLLREKTGWIHSMLEDEEGTVWIAGSLGIYRYRDGVLSTASEAASYRSANALSLDREREILVGTNNGLFKMSRGGGKLERYANQAISSQVNTILEDRQGNLWVGMNASGLRRLEQGVITSFNAVDGLTDNRVLALYEDREGSVWVGTSNGLDRFRDTKLTTITSKQGLRSDNTRSVIGTRDGSLYVFCDGGGISRIQHDIGTDVSRSAHQPVGGDAMFEGSDGALWIGADGSGLTRYKDEKFTTYPGEAERLAKTFISAVGEDSESLIFTDSNTETLRFENGKVVPFTIRGQATPLTARGNYTFTIYRDPGSTLWFGTVKGLLKFSPGGAPMRALQHGIEFPVTSISDDGRGSLWLGGRIPGLTRFRIRDGRVTRYSKKDGLFDDYPSRVLPDDQGNLWISTSNGIYEVSSGDMDGFADGQLGVVRSTVYGTVDGMKTSEASAPNSQPGGARTADGKLWFTTVKGLVVIDPRHMLHNHLIPPVVIESVAIDGETRSLREDLAIKPGTKAIEFHYTALSFRVPERVRFKYRLEGYDHDWVDAGSRRVAYYTNLPPGDYRFRVIAANDDGVWNEAGAAVPFTLQPYVYQQGWFRVLCLLIALLATIAVPTRYTRMMQARSVLLKKLVDERTAELSESKRELEQLAHFDVLTSLPNRRMFSKEIGRMCAHDSTNWTTFSLLLIDFDKFKTINDSYGHDAGDAFLVEASRRLEACTRSTDRVARLGGDEFAILLPGDEGEVRIRNVCERLLPSFKNAILFNGKDITTSASVGVARFPQDGRTEQELYKAADIALYEAKRAGRNNWRVYRLEMQDPAESLSERGKVLATPSRAFEGHALPMGPAKERS